jgi:hypothetical protein
MDPNVKTEDQESKVLDEETLQKSWNDSIGTLRDTLKKAEELEKAKKKPPVDEEDTEDEEEEEGESEPDDDEDDYEPPVKGKMKKSLPDYIADDDSEADIAMDVEPYLKSLATGIDKSLTRSVSKLEKAVANLSEVVVAQGNALLSFANLQKSIDSKVEKIGKTAIPSNSVLSKSVGRFGNSDKKLPSRDSIMQKAVELCKANKMSATDVTILEGRLNKGSDIPDHLKSLFEDKEAK